MLGLICIQTVCHSDGIPDGTFCRRKCRLQKQAKEPRRQGVDTVRIIGENEKKYFFFLLHFCPVMKISVDELTKLRICLETHLDASNHM